MRTHTRGFGLFQGGIFELLHDIFLATFALHCFLISSSNRSEKSGERSEDNVMVKTAKLSLMMLKVLGGCLLAKWLWQWFSTTLTPSTTTVLTTRAEQYTGTTEALGY